MNSEILSIYVLWELWEPAAISIKYLYTYIWYTNNSSGNNSRITTNKSGLVSEQAKDGIDVSTTARTTRQIHKRIIGKPKAAKHLWEHKNSFARLRTRTRAYAQPADQKAKEKHTLEQSTPNQKINKETEAKEIDAQRLNSWSPMATIDSGMK